MRWVNLRFPRYQLPGIANSLTTGKWQQMCPSYGAGNHIAHEGHLLGFMALVGSTWSWQPTRCEPTHHLAGRGSRVRLRLLGYSLGYVELFLRRPPLMPKVSEQCTDTHAGQPLRRPKGNCFTRPSSWIGAQGLRFDLSLTHAASKAAGTPNQGNTCQGQHPALPMTSD